MTELERDLQRRIKERLRLWMHDSFQLYDIAGIEHRRATATIATTLMEMLSAGMIANDVSPDEAAKTIAAYMHAAKRAVELREWRRTNEQR
jgi:hypothetical protein